MTLNANQMFAGHIANKVAALSQPAHFFFIIKPTAQTISTKPLRYIRAVGSGNQGGMSHIKPAGFTRCKVPLTRNIPIRILMVRRMSLVLSLCR